MNEEMENGHMTNFMPNLPFQGALGGSSSEYSHDMMETYESIAGTGADLYYTHDNLCSNQNGSDEGGRNFTDINNTNNSGPILPGFGHTDFLNATPSGFWTNEDLNSIRFENHKMDILDSRVGLLEIEKGQSSSFLSSFPTSSFSDPSSTENLLASISNEVSSNTHIASEVQRIDYIPSNLNNRRRRSTSAKKSSQYTSRKKFKRVARKATFASCSDSSSNKPGKVNLVHQPQHVIQVLEAFAQQFSVARKEAMGLVDRFKELIEIERNYWSYIVDTSTANAMSATSISQDRQSTEDPADSDLNSATSVSSADAHELQGSDLANSDLSSSKSVSSTPRQPSYELDSSQTQSSHEPCALCGVEPLYCCTFRACSYAIHDFSDWKRHEESGKHWPQQRYMCTECPTPSTDSLGNPACGFCLVSFSQLGTSRSAHYLQCTVAMRKAKTFQRCDKLFAHLRITHGMVNPSQQAAASKFSLNTQWPRQCGYCDIIFQTWEERMEHLAEHFKEGLDKSAGKLPFRGPKDSHPKRPEFGRRDDDSDDDDDSNDHRDPSRKVTSCKFVSGAQSENHQQNQSSDTNTTQTFVYNSDYTHASIGQSERPFIKEEAEARTSSQNQGNHEQLQRQASGAKAVAKKPSHLTTREMAAANSHDKGVDLPTAKGAEENEGLNLPSYHATESKRHAALNRSTLTGVDASPRGSDTKTALRVAVLEGNASFVTPPPERGAQVNTQRNRAKSVRDAAPQVAPKLETMKPSLTLQRYLLDNEKPFPTICIEGDPVHSNKNEFCQDVVFSDIRQYAYSRWVICIGRDLITQSFKVHTLYSSHSLLDTPAKDNESIVDRSTLRPMRWTTDIPLTELFYFPLNKGKNLYFELFHVYRPTPTTPKFVFLENPEKTEHPQNVVTTTTTTTPRLVFLENPKKTEHSRNVATTTTTTPRLVFPTSRPGKTDYVTDIPLLPSSYRAKNHARLPSARTNKLRDHLSDFDLRLSSSHASSSTEQPPATPLQGFCRTRNNIAGSSSATRVDLLWSDREEQLRSLGGAPSFQPENWDHHDPEIARSATFSTTFSAMSTEYPSSSLRTSRQESGSSRASSSTNATSILPPTLAPCVLPCEFLSTGCQVWFYPTEIDKWVRHSLSHFSGQPLPSKAICTFCKAEFFETKGDREANWCRRLRHIARHFENLQREEEQRPDLWVIDHMHKHGLMSDGDLEYARRYTERPRGCPGIVSRGHQASEALRKHEKDSSMHYDQDKEDRLRRRNKGRIHRNSRTHH